MTEIIKLTCKCKTCKGDGKTLQRVYAWGHSMPNRELEKLLECLDCTNGVTVMEFDGKASETQQTSWKYPQINGDYSLVQYYDLEWKIYDSKGDDITDSLNIKFIEHITVDDCPDCEGTGKQYVVDLSEGGPIECNQCEKGKIEKVTSFTLFGKSKKEHDEALIKEGRGEVIIEAQSAIEFVKYNLLEENSESHADICDQISIKFRDTLKRRDDAS